MELGHGYLRHEASTGQARRFGLLLGGLAVVVLFAAAIFVAWPDSVSRSVSRPVAHTPAFVAHQLGARRAALPVVSRPRYRATSEVTPGGFQVKLGRSSVSLSSVDGGRGAWTSYKGGAIRRTGYGQELVTVSASGAEQLLQVDSRQGPRTWRWRLDSAGLAPTLRKDGTVAFLGAGGKDTGLRITPVDLLDTQGHAVTPKGLHWSLARRHGADFLELRFDDSSLPIPYLIDPNVTSVSFTSTSYTDGTAADWTVGFTTSLTGALAANGTITVVFPSAGLQAFTVPATPTVVLNSGFANCSATSSTASTTVTITLHDSPAGCALASNAPASLTIDGLTNPTLASSMTKTLFTVKTSADSTVNNPNSSPAAPVVIATGPFVKLQMLDSAESTVPAGTNSATCKTSAATTKVAQGVANAINISPIKTMDAYCNVVTGISDVVAFGPIDGSVTFANATLVVNPLTGATAGNSATANTTGPIIVTASDQTDGTKTQSTSPIAVYAPNGSGTMTVDQLNVSAGASDTLTFTYTAATGGTLGGVLRLTAPAGWPAPTALNTTVSYSGGSGTVAYALQNVNFSAVTLAAGATVTIVYSPTIPSVGTSGAWKAFEGSVGVSFTPLTAGSPTTTINAADGSGSISSSTSLVTAGSTTNTLAFTYTAAAGGLGGGSIVIAIPAGWGSPQTASNTSPNYTTAAGGTGSNTISWNSGMRQLTVSNVTLIAAATLTVTYGNDGGGAQPAAAAVATTSAGISTFTTKENSSGSSPLVALAVSPNVTVEAAAASDLSLTGTPASLTAGSTGSVTVTAIDGYGNTATTFTGTVTFTSNDPQAVLPANYTFTGLDAGVHAFPNSYTLKTAGSRTVTAAAGAVTGTSAGVLVNSALPAATLTATAPSPATAGTGFSVTVTAKDAYGNIATGYTGTVSLTSTDPQVVVPGPYGFVGADNGSHALPVTLKTTGSQTVSASDGTLNATTGSVTVNPGPTSTLLLSGTPASVTAGNTGSVTVTATDAYGNTTPAYTGTVTFTSSDGAWTGPSNYTFTGPNAGVHTFTNAYTLKTSGSRTITATDVPTSSITGTSAAITVNPGAASLALSTIGAAPGSITANGSSTSTVTVRLKDAFGNNLSGSGGTVALSSTLGSLSAVADHADGTYTATLTSTTTVGTASITGTLNAAALAGSTAVAFTPGPTTNFQLTAPGSATAGGALSVGVTAKDAFGNTTPAYSGTVNLTSTDPQVPAPGSHSFTGGDAGTYSFPVTLKAAGSWTVSASDGSSSGTTGAIAVSPAATTVLAVSAPATATAGTPVSVTVTAKDAYGNTTTAYTGTVNLTSTDPQAAALGSHVFAGADAGTFVISATLKTAGSQTISGSDGTSSGSSGAVTVSPGAVNTSASTVTGAPASVLADGSTPVTVTVTLKDGYGNAVPGKTVSVAGTGSAVVSSAAATDPSGVATFSVTDSAVESSTFTATDTSDSLTLPQTPSASFVAGPLATIAISPSSSTVAAGASQAYGVTGSDAYGHSLGAQTATFGIVPDGACVNATSSCSATVSGLHAVTATVSGKTAVASLTVSVGAGSAANSTLAASPTTIVADGVSASTITVSLKDSYGNTLTSGGATVALSTTAGTLSAVTDNGNGTYSANLSASSPGSGTVSGTVNGAPITATAAVVFTNSDTTPPVLATATATGGTLTLSYNEPLDANSTPAAGDFAVLQNLSPDAVTSVSVGGSSVTLSLGSPVVNGDLVTISYTGTATKDLAGNAAATFLNQTVAITGPAPPSAPAQLACVRPLIINSDGIACVAPPPPPPPIKFLGSSPADGAAVTALDSFTLTANHMSSWVSISVARPDGGTTSIASGFGVSYPVSFTATQPGAYTLTATMDDGFNPAQQVTVHVTVVPAGPNVALPSKAGSVESASGDTSVRWTPGTFPDAVRVNVEDQPSIGGSFGNGSRVVRVTVARLSDGASLQTFDQPLELVFSTAPAGVASFSEDGVAWAPLPLLTTGVLPPGQADGYFVDPAGAVHVLTRHLTFFGVLIPRSTKLSLTVSGSVVALASGARRISVTVQATQSSHLVVTLFSPHGELVQTWTRVIHAGATMLRLTVPASKVQRGTGTIVLQASAAGRTTQSAIPITL
jgi:Invasin, domain 3/Bacterial Ig-like domain (group 1)